MANWSVAAGASVLAVAVIAGATAATGRIGREGAAGENREEPAAVVTIDPLVGEIFTPATFPVDAGYLSAGAAWLKWSRGKPLPDSIPATYGSLNLLTGPEGSPGVEVKVADTPVWAFQEHYCVFTTPARSCTTWTFLDAKTGNQIDTTSVPDR